MWMLLGVPAGLAWLIVWGTINKTGANVDAAERIRGWSSVVRNLPATVPFVGVVLLGLVLAVRAARLGAGPAAMRALAFHTAALLVVLLIIVMSATEDVMQTRPSTVKWMLVPAVLAVTAAVGGIARRAARR
jgi:hypothetical protein